MPTFGIASVAIVLATNVPGGDSTVLVALITSLGGIVVAFIQIYRAQRDIKGNVDGQMTALIAQIREEQARSLDLTARLAAAEERERLRGHDDPS